MGLNESSGEEEVEDEEDESDEVVAKSPSSSGKMAHE